MGEKTEPQEEAPYVEEKGYGVVKGRSVATGMTALERILEHCPEAEQEFVADLSKRILNTLISGSPDQLRVLYERLNEAPPELVEQLPEDPEEMSDEALQRLETGNLLRVLTRYRELGERSIPAERLRRDLGFSRQHMNRLRQQRRLLGIRLPFRQGYHYPAWQFSPETGETLEGLPELLEAAEESGLDSLALDSLMTSVRFDDGELLYHLFAAGEEGRRRVLRVIRASHDIGS